MNRIVLTALTLLWCSIGATAQSYVTLHEDCNYAGKSYTLAAGTYNGYQMKIGNDRLSSMQIPYGFKVTIYENDDYKGKSQTYTSNVACLDATWNDMASSIVVESTYNAGGYGQSDYVTFYNDAYQKGYSQSLRPGIYSGSQLGALKYNISSFTINGSLRVKLYINNESNSGYSAAYDVSQSYLPEAQNDKIGSVTVEYNSGGTGGGGNTGGGGGYGNNTYATFYTDCSFDGNSIRLMPGYYSGDKLGLFKYNISSVQVPSNLRVKAFINNDNLYGQSTTITENISCMDYNMKNKIGSIVVEERRGNNGGGGYNGGGGGGYNPTGNETVIIYTDGNYKGQSAAILPGTYSTMTMLSGFPDNALSSLQVPAGYRVILYEFENFGGKSYTVNESKSGFVISGWNDKASSIKVYRD